MIRLHIIGEGQTEEEFIKSVLREHLGYLNISTDVHCVTTKRTKKKVYRGGAVSYGKIKKDIMLWLKQDRSQEARFTTMLDLYALPNDFPKFDESQNKSDPYQKVEQLEAALGNEINDPRFIPYIQLHEFEALILSDPNKLTERFPEYQVNIKKLLADCENFTSPELINDGSTTAPSKRINKFIPGYEDTKVSVAPLIAKKIGLPAIRQKCPHFDAWISQLEQLR
ncbi:DUF4276 family protein [Coleofasciculus sp.]|uniref:DUF4276 family protein n=1 Tax=Coleofasciculus sp. TaxID=3100458 RepID=UPI0039F8EE50